MNNIRKTPITLALSLLIGCSSDPETMSLAEALRGAHSGDVIALGNGLATGSFEVPAGVTLRGSGAATTLAGTEGNPVVVLGPGAKLENLTVVPQGAIGVVAQEFGAPVAISDVRILLDRGVGIGIGSIEGAALTRVRVIGTVNEENAGGWGDAVSPTEAPAFGIVAVRSVALSLTDVEVSGTANAGAIFIDSGARWVGGGVHDVLGSAVLQSDGTLQTESVSISDVFRGAGVIPGYGLVSADNATTSTVGLEVQSVEGAGVLHDGGSASHDGLVAMGNSLGGVWSQVGGSLALSGGSVLMDNGLAGVFAVEAASVDISDSMIGRTTALPWQTSAGSLSPIGDGIHLVAPERGIALRSVDLIDNARVGLVADFGSAAPASIRLQDVSVSTSGSALGIIGQSGAPAGWDNGVERLGTAAANDAAFTGSLDVVNAVSPTERPLSSIPDNLSAFGAVSPTE